MATFDTSAGRRSLSILWHELESGVIGLSLDLGRLFGHGVEDPFRSVFERRFPNVPAR